MAYVVYEIFPKSKTQKAKISKDFCRGFREPLTSLSPKQPLRGVNWISNLNPARTKIALIPLQYFNVSRFLCKTRDVSTKFNSCR